DVDLDKSVDSLAKAVLKQSSPAEFEQAAGELLWYINNNFSFDGFDTISQSQIDKVVATSKTLILNVGSSLTHETDHGVLYGAYLLAHMLISEVGTKHFQRLSSLCSQENYKLDFSGEDKAINKIVVGFLYVKNLYIAGQA